MCVTPVFRTIFNYALFICYQNVQSAERKVYILHFEPLLQPGSSRRPSTCRRGCTAMLRSGLSGGGPALARRRASRQPQPPRRRGAAGGGSPGMAPAASQVSLPPPGGDPGPPMPSFKKTARCRASVVLGFDWFSSSLSSSFVVDDDDGVAAASDWRSWIFAPYLVWQ